ncbi:MAG: GNAT family N-acetyltransferase [Bacilli bacterium]|nr:GNAT family N-acetyltransferase [Bacilli bacterium]
MNAEIDVTNIVLETDRLILRIFRQEDLDDFFEYASVPGVGEMAGWPHHPDKNESKYRLDKFIREKHTFAIVHKADNKVIGSLGIEECDAEGKLTEFASLRGREIGYVLAKPYWGQGIMPEAVKCVVNYLFDVLDYDFLLCGHYDFNLQSKRVQEKCGFVPYRTGLKFNSKLNDELIPGSLNLMLNPHKDIKLEFSHPETLVYKR